MPGREKARRRCGFGRWDVKFFAAVAAVEMDDSSEKLLVVFVWGEGGVKEYIVRVW